MRYLLDTDTCIAVMKGRDAAVARLAALAPDDCGVSTVSIFELKVGVAKCREPEREAAKLRRFLALLETLPLDTAAARKAGAIRGALERRGLGIGPYDVLLAGQAVAHGLILVSGNAREFDRVPGLQFESW